MEKTKVPSIRVVGLFPGGIKVVRRLYETDPARCGYFVCDTGPGFLEASPVPGKLLLGKDDECFPKEIVDGAKTLVLVSILDGPTAGRSAEMLLRMATRAKEAGIGVHCIISHSVDKKEEDAALKYVKEMEEWDDSYIQIIYPRQMYFSYRFPPKTEVMARRVKDAMVDEAEGFIRTQLYWEERFAPIHRKLDELIKENEMVDTYLSLP